MSILENEQKKKLRADVNLLIDPTRALWLNVNVFKTNDPRLWLRFLGKQELMVYFAAALRRLAPSTDWPGRRCLT